MTRVAALLACVALAGCTLEPKYVRPAAAVPAQWPQGDAYTVANEPVPPTISYRDIFRDPALQSIVEQALVNNQDLRVALGNIAQARAQYRIQRAQIFPQIDASGRVTIAGNNRGGTTTTTGTTTTGTTTGTGTTGTGTTGTGTTGTGTTTGDMTGTGTTGTGTTGTGVGTGTTTTGGTIVTSASSTTSYTANIGVTAFELDLFGRLRSLNRAALQQYLATEAAARAVRLTLVADIADAYLRLATDRSLLAIARETESLSARSVQLTQARLSGGVAPRTDLRQAQTVLEQARADLADLTTTVAQDRNALDLLAGAPVVDAALPPSIESVDTLLADLPAGLDSAVLLRRPDVAQAEHALRAANARIGAARAAFFPRISLTALAGFASGGLTSLFSSGSFTWSAAPSVTLPIFDGGETLANLSLARAQRQIALAEYQRAIQAAFRDVADALARRGTVESQLAARARFEEAASDTAALQQARYREGVDPFLNTLDAQRTLYSARRTLAQTRLIRALARVDLYRSIGGDMLVDEPGSAAIP